MIKIIAKAVRIMNLFSATEPRLSVSEVARRMEIPKSTAHNILKSLAAENLIERCGKDAYALGHRHHLADPEGQGKRGGARPRSAARPRAGGSLRESVYLTVRDGDARALRLCGRIVAPAAGSHGNRR